MEEKAVNTKIQKMIEEMCPDGVEYKKIGDICTIRNGYTPSKKHLEYWEDGTVPWFRMDDIRTHGRVLSDSLQHVTPQAVKGQLFQADSLIFATTATIGEHAIISVPFLCNQRFTVLTIRDEMKEAIEPRYLFHYGFIIDEWCKRNTKSGTMAAVDMNRFREIEIPIPPLQVQEEIVRILDAFTNLTAELTTELAMRTKQYAYYMDELLRLENVEGVEYKRVGDIFKRLRGTPITARKMKEIAREDGNIRIFAGGKTVIDASESDIPKANIIRVPAVLVQSRGIVDFVYYDKPFTFKNEMWAYTADNTITVKYLYYCLKNSLERFRDEAAKMGSMPQISIRITEDFVIPIPPLSVQQDIVTKLDAFSSYCTDLTTGLPAEIAAREKQYAYYRDAILQFNGK